MFFEWDTQLRCPTTGEKAVCNSSDLNEELGQVGAAILVFLGKKKDEID